MTERERLTARVLLFDPQDRILLLKGRLPSAPDEPGWWFTVGGGIDPGETLQEAAAREIIEETGFKNFELGPVVGQTNEVLVDRKGRPIRHVHTFLTARCAGGEPSREGWQPLEREFIDDIRWWSLSELQACEEPIYPLDLVERVSAILHANG